MKLTKPAARSSLAVCTLAALVWGGARATRAAEPASVDELGINQLQVIGTHNSYHVLTPPKSGKGVSEWKYTHAPLDVQLDRGVRSLELDLHFRSGVFEVLHVPLVDEGSTCRTLREGLATVRQWSDAHPRHVPISFLFELKKEGPGLDKRIRAVDAAALEALDELLRTAFPPERLITPDDVRGQASTLRDAVRTAGWPRLAASRGKMLFILHDEGKTRELYTAGHPSLRGRAMFVRSDEQREDGATLVLDNPRSKDIPRLVAAGYFIRTRADSDLRGGTDENRARFERALASGAQIISTDFPAGEPHAENYYTVELPAAAAARVDPVNSPAALAGQTVKE
ncbi:MAG TPA: Ca2+-dependent phosphoinositide-specific phospholipase C [Pirellulales bacterium]|nr:Ca2+-dependent phosphoinositide-specific phospholipase C [Pirellulales bacterium]